MDCYIPSPSVWPPAILWPATSLLGVGGRLPLNLAGSRHLVPCTRACPQPSPSLSDGEIIFNGPWPEMVPGLGGEQESRTNQHQAAQGRCFWHTMGVWWALLGLGAARGQEWEVWDVPRGQVVLHCPPQSCSGVGTTSPMPQREPPVLLQVPGMWKVDRKRLAEEKKYFSSSPHCPQNVSSAWMGTALDTWDTRDTDVQWGEN